MKTAYKTCVIMVAAGAVTLVGVTFVNKSHREPLMPEHLVCVMNVSRRIPEADGYVAGYSYELLKRFAADKGCTIDIRVAGRRENCADSLAAGVFDIVVEGMRDLPDSLAAYVSCMDSLALWMVSPQLKDIVPVMDKWLLGYYAGESYGHTHRRFADVIGNPHHALARGERRSHLSPYDSLIRHYSSEIGWDWRLLAAMIWQESHFHIEVMSHRRAAGLMQITPPTAGRYELENLLDPEENIRTGVLYLHGIQRMFRRRAANAEELHKIALGAYNAGPGHIKDAFAYARHVGAGGRTWSVVVDVLPALADSELVAETEVIRHGTFNVVETRNYVDGIMEMYDVFKRLCPDAADTPIQP